MNEISIVSRKNQVAQRERFLVPKKAKIFTQASWDSSMPGICGLSIFIEADNDGETYSAGKTKAVNADRLPKIRASLDDFGATFTKASMQNTTETSFKSLLNGILDGVLSNSDKESDED